MSHLFRKHKPAVYIKPSLTGAGVKQIYDPIKQQFIRVMHKLSGVNNIRKFLTGGMTYRPIMTPVESIDMKPVEDGPKLLGKPANIRKRDPVMKTVPVKGPSKSISKDIASILRGGTISQLA